MKKINSRLLEYRETNLPFDIFYSLVEDCAISKNANVFAINEQSNKSKEFWKKKNIFALYTNDERDKSKFWDLFWERIEVADEQFA